MTTAKQRLILFRKFSCLDGEEVAQRGQYDDFSCCGFNLSLTIEINYLKVGVGVLNFTQK